MKYETSFDIKIRNTDNNWRYIFIGYTDRAGGYYTQTSECEGCMRHRRQRPSGW